MRTFVKNILAVSALSTAMIGMTLIGCAVPVLAFGAIVYDPVNDANMGVSIGHQIEQIQHEIDLIQNQYQMRINQVEQLRIETQNFANMPRQFSNTPQNIGSILANERAASAEVKADMASAQVLSQAMGAASQTQRIATQATTANGAQQHAVVQDELLQQMVEEQQKANVMTASAQTASGSDRYNQVQAIGSTAQAVQGIANSGGI